MVLAARAASEVDGTSRGFYVRSRSFAFGVTSDDLVATIAWGTFDEHEARALGALWAITFDGPPRDTLLDVTQLVMSDGGAFATFRDVLEPHRQARARVVRRQAVVFGGDYGAAFVRGYLAVYPPPYEVRDFASRGEALRWLGHDGCCDEALGVLDDARQDLLVRLRDWLDRVELDGATIERAELELGVTARTLQRRLASAGTRFAAELARAQIARAQRLMLDGERKLSDIALEIGCATPSSFSDLFRRLTGETPSQWRRRLRIKASPPS